MDAAQVQSQLLDLPAPFRRFGSIYDALISSQAAAESLYTLGSDASSGSLSVSGASNGWLSAWGDIFGLPRAASESNAVFRARLLGTLINPVGTVAAMETFGQLILGVAVTVTENLPNVGYEISIPASVSTTDIQSFVDFLDRIRPAGVPFQINLLSNPLMLTTYSYVGVAGFGAAYLGYGKTYESFTLSPSTQNAQPIAPDNFLTDPLLNGNISLGFVS